jgi:hypothetical protein
VTAPALPPRWLAAIERALPCAHEGDYGDHRLTCPAGYRSALARELAPLLAELEAEVEAEFDRARAVRADEVLAAEQQRDEALAGEARLRAAIHAAVGHIALGEERRPATSMAKARNVLYGALAAPPSAALAGLRGLRAATYELLGASEDPSRVDGLFEAWDRARAALAATAFLGGEGEASGGD